MRGLTYNRVPWWKKGIMYQIYPLSFKDTDEDRIGNINGITEKLDYLKDLGIRGIWLSPVYPSPMFDCGYDIKDYQDINPLLGNMKDFEGLIERAHSLGIKIILDGVFALTSTLHPWFLESKSSRINPKADWYIWRDEIPNNWVSVFGGSAWEYTPERKQYYLHTFLKEQADLNWRNPEVKDAIFRVIEFWLEKGVDGFRLDSVNFYVKDRELRNNPLREERNGTEGGVMRENTAYAGYIHKYDKTQPENLEIIEELREKILNKYGDVMAVGEVGATPYEKNAAEYCGNGTNRLSMAFNFSFIFSQWEAQDFHRRIEKWRHALHPDAWPCYTLSNHDRVRAISRYATDSKEETEKRAKVAAALLFTLRGTPFIYYGEEIGMRQVPIPLPERRDPVGITFPRAGRDGCRTPMQWDENLYGDFSSVKPWLRVDDRYKTINVTHEQADNHSILHFYKRMSALRNSTPVLQVGTYEPLEKNPTTYLAYTRKYESEEYLVVLNFEDKQSEFDFSRYGLSAKRFEKVMKLYNEDAEINTKFVLESYDVAILKSRA